MTDKEMDITQQLMREIGLEVDDRSNIVDQDTNNILMLNGKNLTAPGVQPSKGTTEFDPLNNVKLSNILLGYYAQKLEEDGRNPVNIFSSVESGEKVCLEVRDIDNNVIRSNEFKNQPLMYVDMIFKLGGEENIDLSSLDNDKPSNRKQKRRR